MPISHRQVVETDFERLITGAFRRNSWHVLREVHGGEMHSDLVFERGGKTYLVEMKSSSEGRGDRLVPLLSQAILQAQAYARLFREGTIPVAVVAAERIPSSVAEKVRQFACRFAPDVGIGVIDSGGLRVFAGHGLEVLNASPKRSVTTHSVTQQRLPYLFSDLNQWMLKVVLAQALPEDLLSAPRANFRNASQLAQAANVSVMSAVRFVRQLEKEGFLEEKDGKLEVVRTQELLERWAIISRTSEGEFPVRWIIKRDWHRLSDDLKAYAKERNVAASSIKTFTSPKMARYPRTCVGLFAAAKALGYGLVHGVPPYIYLERADADLLQHLGLSADAADHNPDAYIRVPANRESVFRAAVMRDGLPVSDILQVWLDVSAHPSRGQAQANEIRRQALAPLFGRK